MAREHLNAVVGSAGADGESAAGGLTEAGLRMVLPEQDGWVGLEEPIMADGCARGTPAFGNAFGRRSP